MTTENGLFDNSELALAAYAIFPVITTQSDTENYIKELKITGMTEEQAIQFSIRYPKIVAVIPDTSSGFSATVFKSADGQLTVAIRGTTPGVDLLEDISLTIYGAAYKQIVDMYNWWTKETATVGQTINQYSFVWGATEPAGSVLKMEETREAGGPHPYTEYKWLVKTDSVAATAGALAGLPDINSVTVTGHSLGGHLASAFTALFSPQVDQTYTYNGPGFKNTDANTAFFSALGGVTPLIVADKVTRVQANDALPGESQIEAISNLHGGTPGTLLQIAIEDKGFLEGDIGTGNHSIVNTTDSLAIYNLLLKLDASLDIKIFNTIFHSASHEVEATRERLVDAIQKIFGIDQIDLPVGDAYRNEFYQAIYTIQDDTTFKSLSGVTVKSSGDISADKAKTDFSAFISLYYLSPIYLAGANLNNAANSTLYNEWASGKFGNDYLSDRSNMLHLLLARNAADQDDSSPDAKEIVYYDYSIDREVFTKGGHNTIAPEDDIDKAQIHFGSTDVDNISGGNRNDRFYGSAGKDSYNFSGSFGHDKIIDADGGTIKIDGATLTVTRIGKMPGGNKDGAYLFLEADGTATTGKEGWSVIVNGTTATITTKDTTGKFQTIEIKNFDANDATLAKTFGITLNDGVLWAVPDQTSAYAAETNNSKLGAYQAENIYFHRYRSQTNYYLNYSDTDPRSLRIKQLYNDAGFTNLSKPITYSATSFNDATTSTTFEGGSGNDLLQGKDQTAAGVFDILFGLDGDDIIIGEGADKNNASMGDDADVLVGGHGNDQLYGGGGNDWLYATDSMSESYSASIGQSYNPGEGYGSFFEALYKNAFLYDPVTQTNTTTRLAMENEGESNYLDGGDGNNRLVGGNFNDTLIGGNGSDGIYGGAGKDMISGGNSASVTKDDEIWGDSSIGLFGGMKTTNMMAPNILPLAGDYTRAYFFKDGDGNAATHDPQLRYNNDLALFNDVIDGGSGHDMILGEIGADVISGGDGVDTLFGDRFYNGWYIGNLQPGQFQQLSAQYHGDDVIDGGANSDYIIGGGGNDVLMGGNEAVAANPYSDLIYGDLGIWVFDREIGVTDPEKRAKASDTQWWGNDIIFGGTGNDRLVGEGGNDVIDGGDDNDQIYGDWQQQGQLINELDYKNNGGSDVLDGAAGDDQLYGGAGDDTLTGGTNNDSMSGEEGSDSYIVNASDGQDTIYDSVGNNILKLVGAYLNNGAVEAVLSNHSITIYTSADKHNWVKTTDAEIATFEKRFKDGADNALRVHCLLSTGTDTKIVEGIDYYTLGVGQDLSLDASNILSGPIAATLLGDGSAILQVPTTSGGNIQLSISDWNTFVDISKGVQTAGFAIDASANTVDEFQLSGKSGNDTITGGAADEYFYGNAGNDVLNGGAGMDTASYLSASAAVQVNLATGLGTGAAGNDTLSGIENIIGSNYNDTLTGNSGNNVINGGSGNDTVSYLLASAAVQVNLSTTSAQDTVGDGIDTLIGIENLTGSAHNDTLSGNDADNTLIGDLGDDTLDGGAGIDTASYLSASAAVQVNLSTCVSTGADGNDILAHIENIIGSDHNDSLTGNDGNNVLTGGADNDSINGGAGNDTLIGGSGGDTLNGGDGIDTASYSSAAAAVQVNLATGLSSGAEGNDTLTNIENIIGSSRDDTLTGNDSANVLNGGLGNDSLAGGAGMDIYSVARNDGFDIITSSDSSDIIQLSVDPAKVFISRDGSDYLIRYKDSMDIIDPAVQEGIRIVGTSGVKTINFVDSNGNPVLDGMGNPVSWTLDAGIKLQEDNIRTISVNASQGEIENYSPGYYVLIDKNKLLNNDDLSAADGWDVIGVRPTGWVQSRVYFGDFYEQPIVAFTPGVASMTLEYFVQKNGSGPIYAQTIDVNFAEAVGGVVTLAGTIGIDLLDAIDAAQTIIDGGPGDDYISGGYGNDTILHRFGDGNDLIDMRETGYSLDTLILMGKNGSAVDEDDVTFEQDGMDFLIHLDNGIDNETLKVVGYFQDIHDGAIGSIKLFADVTAYHNGLLKKEWTPDATNKLRDNINQKVASAGDDKMTNWSGDSYIWQGYLDNTVDGLAGNDIISTNDGDDILIGGLGNDTLAGGSGNDSYRFAAGDGIDTIINFDDKANNDTTPYGETPTEDTDILEISNIDYRDLWLHQENNDLIINVLGTSDQLAVKNWFAAHDNSNDENELDAIRVIHGGTRSLTNFQDSIALSDNFDRLLQAMAIWEQGHPGAAPDRLSLAQSDYDNAWMVST